MSTIKLVARGDNGYRCSCCGRSWKIEQEFNTVEELLKYCIEEKKRAESFGDGFEAQSIYVIENNEDGSETSRHHPDEAELIKKIGAMKRFELLSTIRTGGYDGSSIAQHTLSFDSYDDAETAFELLKENNNNPNPNFFRTVEKLYPPTMN
jgi:hypothetical protein